MEETGTINVLILSQDNVQGDMVAQAVQELGFIVYREQALLNFAAKLEECSPNLVIIDESAIDDSNQAILDEYRKKNEEQYIPVLVLISQEQINKAEEYLSFADDLLRKPFLIPMLRAKLILLSKVAKRYRNISRNENTLRNYRELIATEQAIARNIFSSVMRMDSINIPNIRYVLSPMSTFNGDLILAAKRPDDGLHIIIGDFTGHGLPAAIGSLPLAEIFYTMSAKGLEMKDILFEINRKLRVMLPPSIFCAAAMLEIDANQSHIRVWNGGLPSGLLYRPKVGLATYFRSSHLPLGILSDKEFNCDIQLVDLKERDKIYFFSDGIIEAENGQKEMFGEQRLLDIFKNKKESGPAFKSIIRTIKAFTGETSQGDDMTFFEYSIGDTHEGEWPIHNTATKKSAEQ